MNAWSYVGKEKGGGMGESLNSSGSHDGEEHQQNDNIEGDGTMIEIECKEERVGDDEEEERVEEDQEGEVEQEFFETSITLAKRLLFLGYCELDGGQISSARQRLVRECKRRVWLKMIYDILCTSRFVVLESHNTSLPSSHHSLHISLLFLSHSP